jgi:3-oxosteroid 1-dehydrogenase
MAAYDFVIVGSGGGGLSAALFARSLGATAVVVEKGARVGGTYAYSTGLVWVPANRQMLAAGLEDSAEEAGAHIRNLSGGRHDETVLQAFTRNAARAVAHLEDRCGVPFELPEAFPDYYSDAEGGKTAGRHLASPVFAAKEELGDSWAEKLANSPYYAMVPASWSEIQAWGGFGSLATWDWTKLGERIRADYRAFGSATMGYMLAAALRTGVEVETCTEAVSLSVSDGRVTGVRVRGPHGEAALKQRWDPHPMTVRLGAPTVDGSGLTMALERGAAMAMFEGQLLVPAYNIPGEEAGGEPLYRLFLREMQFPGGIVVNRAGNRFSDETFYRDMVREMAHLDPITQTYPNYDGFFVFDGEWKQKYPLGPVMAGEVPEWLAAGGELGELARQIGVDPEGLVATVERFNSSAARGEDPEFHRGSTPHGRNGGDPEVTPNPCVRPLRPPFYALPVYLGTAGTSSGLVITPNAQVMHVRGEPLEGLYAAGNVAANLAEGLFYNGGISNAKAITFAYLAVHHAMGMTQA